MVRINKKEKKKLKGIGGLRTLPFVGSDAECGGGNASFWGVG